MPFLKYLICLCTLALGVASGPFAYATNAEDLLPPEEAFQAKVVDVDGRAIQVEYTIAKGYFLYREKFKFKALTPEVIIGAPVIPLGEKKQDPFFGEVQTHRNSLLVTLPVSYKGEPIDRWVLSATSQGCSDIGVCYPPFTHQLTVSQGSLGISLLKSLLPGAPPEKKRSVESPSVASSENLGEEFLSPSEAFSYEILPQVNHALPIRWKVAKGYFLYREKFEFTLKEAYGVAIGQVEIPPGDIKDDPYFGRTAILRNTFETQLLLTGLNEATEAVLSLTYQGCADEGICYPPITRDVKVNFTPTQAASVVGEAAGGTAVATSEQGRLAATLAHGSIWLIISIFFGLGLLLTFTPCVLPMVPILSSLIVGQGRITTLRAFQLSFVYVLAMALTYTIAGVIIGLTGENIQIWFQNPWVITVFAALFVLLALAMFGFYELQMPQAIQNRLTAVSNRQTSGTLKGAAVMGLLSALIVGPCITAPLVAALVYIGQTGDAVMGGLALFALGMGMGMPLLVVGVSAGRLLPKAGVWMDTTNAFFGVLMLALAIWMLDRIVPSAVTLLLSAALLIVTAVYLNALDAVPAQSSGWRKLAKGVGVLLLLYGVILFISVMAGKPSFLKPLAGLGQIAAVKSGAQFTPVDTLPFRHIKGIKGLEQALTDAREQGQVVMLDFYADWCVTCKEMEAFTFSNAGVKSVLRNTLWLQADVTANDDEDQALMKQFNIYGPPAILFFDSNGLELPGARIYGFVEASAFISHVRGAYGF